MKQIEAFLSDVDNTFLANNSLAFPSDRVTTAFREAGEVVKTGILTARQPQKAHYLVDYLGLDVAGMSNGAQIYDGKKEHMVLERVLDPMAVLTIAEELKRMGVPFWVQDTGIDYVITDEKGQDEELKKYVPLGAYKPEKPFVIVANDVDVAVREYLAEMIGKGFTGLTSFPAHRHANEKTDVFVTHEKTNKRDAVITIAEHLGIDPKEIAGVGDGLNDIDFMKACGLAIAVGNAVPEVQAQADHVVAPWNKDGVAEAIEQFVLFDRHSPQ